MAYTHRTTVNIYSVYELGTSSSFNNDPTLKNSLFGGVRLTENADIDKYQYSGYRTGFERKSSFSFPGGGFGENVINFGVDMSSSAHVNNKKKTHFNSCKRSNTRFRTYTNSRKDVFN